jgi:GMP synthase (glutamine-hydrolysing)
VICFVSLEHDSWLENLEMRNSHYLHLMDVKLKLEALAGRPCLVRRYTEVTPQGLQGLGIEALVISGNGTDWPEYDSADLAGLQDVIRGATLPILGLCGGHQLIAMAHGAPVDSMRPLRPGEPDVTDLSAPGYLKEWGFMPVEVVKPDPLFDELDAAPVFLEVHHCEIKELPAGFDNLACTPDCAIQVLKQRGKPVYSTQFHPESYTESAGDRRNPLVNLVYPDGYPEARPDGRALIANFFRIAGVLD